MFYRAHVTFVLATGRGNPSMSNSGEARVRTPGSPVEYVSTLADGTVTELFDAGARTATEEG